MSTPRTARRIDGRALAARLREQAAEVTSTLRERGGPAPAADRCGGVARGNEPYPFLNSGRRSGVSQRRVKAGTPTPEWMASTVSRLSFVLRHWATG